MQVSIEALHAMRRIMITVRSLGYDGVDSAKIAAIMDEAEYLPTILIDGENCTNGFGEQLRHMANKWFEFTGIADEYEAATENARQHKSLIAA